jgi:hypothetical protein
MGLSPLLNTNTTVNAWVDKAFTVPANHPSVFFWQPQFDSHSNFPRNLSVTLRQLGFFSNFFLSQTKESTNTL